MATVNINKKVNDQFYRYKMPKVIAKVEGRGNGIKTVVVNMSDVSKSLQVPPAYPTKYIGIELGAQVILDQRNDRYIVNGAHDTNKLQKLLYDFIDKYVLCPSCDNPETVIEVFQKTNKIKRTCKACGKTSLIEHSHKLNTYVIKNPPPKEYKMDNNHEANSHGENNVSNENKYALNQETVWLTDTSEAAVEQRKATLSKRAAELVINDELEKTVEDRLEIFKLFVEKVIKNTTDDYIVLIAHEKKRLDLFEESIWSICEVLFTQENLETIIIKHKSLFLSFCHGSEKSQLILLGYIEYYVSKYSEIIPNSSIIKLFKTLYDSDIVEEDSFLIWDQKKSTRYAKDSLLVDRIHQAVRPFITWLKTAEEESDDDEDSIEFKVDEKSDEEKIMNSKSRYSVPIVHDDDDLNIDEI